MNIAKEKERRFNILEKADKLKKKGLILSEISEIVGVMILYAILSILKSLHKRLP